MIRRSLAGALRNLLLLLLKSLMLTGLLSVVALVKGWKAFLRLPWRSWFTRLRYVRFRGGIRFRSVRMRPAFAVAGLAVCGLLIWMWWPAGETVVGPRYFAADLQIPPESRAYIGNDSLFREELVAMGTRLNIHPSWVLAVMYHESRLNPRAVNLRGSGATGLIQFMGPALKDINARLGSRYYLADVRAMSAVEQLPLVEEYFQMVKERYGPISTFTDTYLAVLFPKAIGEPHGHVLFSRPGLRYRQNSGLDHDRDGHVTVGDIDRRLRRMFPDVEAAGLANR